MVKSPATKSLDPMSGGVSGSIPWNMDFDLSSPDTLLIRLSGNWKIANRLPAATEVAKQLSPGARIKKVSFDATALGGWDSGLINFLLKVFDLCAKAGIAADKDSLPSGVKGLVALATAVPERAGARKDFTRESLLPRIGAQAIDFWNSAAEMLAFIGEASIAFGKLLIGKARFQRSDFFASVQSCGVESLAIVSLISLLVGLILAFVAQCSSGCLAPRFMSPTWWALPWCGLWALSWPALSWPDASGPPLPLSLAPCR
jgi:phospholipid/cholesterol/gamma-HCH transport system permease protein